MRRLFHIGLLLLGIVPSTAAAQTAAVTGTVRDGGGTPLPGVNVALEGTTRGAATDAAGRYRISTLSPGTYTLVASAIGFETARQEVSLEAGDVRQVDFVLQETVLQADEVVVTASRREQLTRDAPVSVSVLRAQELQARNTVALDDALRYVPGVQLAGEQVSVRGSSGFSFNTGSRVLLLLDGLPFLGPDRESIPFHALPLAQVERVEVLKGPASALYGGGALGGVINVITEDAPDVPETSIRTFSGAYEPVRYAAWRQSWDGADTPRLFGGLTVTHARQIAEGLGGWVHASYQADRGYRQLAAERDATLYAKVSWRSHPAVRLDVLGGFTWRKSDSFLYWNGLDDPLSPGTLSLGSGQTTGSSDQRILQFSLLPSVTHLLRPDLFYAVKGRLFGAVIQPLDEDGRPRPTSTGTVGARYGGEVQLDWAPADDRYLTAGVTADALATESSFFLDAGGNPELRSQPEGAAFVQWEQDLVRGASLVAGLRYDAYRIDRADVATKLSPKVNLSLPLDPFTVRLAFGQGFRVPSLAERFVNNQDFFPIIPNVDLRPEESTSYEVGLRGTLPLAESSVEFDAAVFWNDFAHLVEPTFVTEHRTFQFVNLTRARIRGGEATVEVASRRGRLQAGYTFLDADDLTAGRPLVFRSRHLFKAALTAPLPGPFDAGIDYRTSSRPERVDSDFALFVPDADVMVPIRVLDVRVGVQWDRFRIALLVDNALDYYYVERPALLAPPRHYTLQLQADL